MPQLRASPHPMTATNGRRRDSRSNDKLPCTLRAKTVRPSERPHHIHLLESASQTTSDVAALGRRSLAYITKDTKASRSPTAAAPGSRANLQETNTHSGLVLHAHRNGVAFFEVWSCRFQLARKRRSSESQPLQACFTVCTLGTSATSFMTLP